MTNTQTQLLPQNLSMDNKQNQFFIFISRITRFILFFAYASLPMWTSWLASQTGYRDISSFDMLIAMAWMPISGAIIALSFMKFGWKHAIKGTLTFILLNAVAAACIATWMYL